MNIESDPMNMNKEDERFKNLDDLLVRFGQFGAFQRRVVFAVCFVAFSTAFNNLGYVFWAAKPDYHCSPSTENISTHSIKSTDEDLLNLTVPWESDGQGGLRRSRCSRYVLPTQMNDGGNGSTTENNWNESFNINRFKISKDRHIAECESWKFATEQYRTTIVSEWNLVCSRGWLASLTQSTYMAGRIFGTLIYGHISDRYGRRIALMSSVLGQLICSFGCCWVPNIYLFLAVRFLLGIQTTGEFQSAFVIVTEMVGPRWRVFAGALIEIFWSFGYMTIPGIAYLLRDRFHFQLALSVPLCLLGILYWVVPETPRWLLAQGRRKECRKVLEKMFKDSNRLKDFGSKDFMSHLQTPDSRPTESTQCSLLDLFRTTNIRRSSLILLFSWFVNSFVFYGLSLVSSSLGGNEYLTFFLSGLVEIPANLMFLFSFTRFGRPIPFSVAMIIAGLALISILFVPQELPSVVIALAMIGKAAITCSYSMIYLYSTEVYPTVMRSIGVGAGTCFARIGGVMAPLAAELRYTWSALPPVIYGGLALAAGALVSILPETKDRPMPQTVEDGEQLNECRCRSDSLGICCWSKKASIQCFNGTVVKEEGEGLDANGTQMCPQNTYEVQEKELEYLDRTAKLKHTTEDTTVI